MLAMSLGRERLSLRRFLSRHASQGCQRVVVHALPLDRHFPFQLVCAQSQDACIIAYSLALPPRVAKHSGCSQHHNPRRLVALNHLSSTIPAPSLSLGYSRRAPLPRSPLIPPDINDPPSAGYPGSGQSLPIRSSTPLKTSFGIATSAS